MVLTAMLEVLLHIDTVTNVDLFFQGVYFLKLRLTHRAGPGRATMQPHWSYETQRQAKRDKLFAKGSDPHNLLRPQTVNNNDDSSCFASKGFLIRYMEEEAEVNDVVLFRSELATEANFQATDVLLEVELWFNDLSKCGQPAGWRSNWQKFPFQEYKKVQSQTYRLRRAATGFCEFVPIHFDHHYQCTVALQVEATMLQFKFAPSPEVPSLQAWLFGSAFAETSDDQLVPLAAAENVYHHFSTLVNKMYNTIQWIFQDISGGISESKNPFAESISALDVPTKFECAALPLDKPARAAEEIVA